MGKKNSDGIQVIMDTPVEVENEVLESEAYQNPRPDVNVDATVLKTIGAGGPVPIVAPKRETIQLQPIVVPLAVVPYMAQDGDSLRTDATPKKKSQEQSIKDEANEGAINEKIEKIEKRTRVNKRIFSFFTLLFAVLVMIPFILSNFYDELFNTKLVDLNVIGQITAWAQGVQPANMLITITGAVTFGFAILLGVLSLIGILFGAYSHILNIGFAIIAFIPGIVQIAFKGIKGQFDLMNDTFLLAVIVASAVLLILTFIFSHVLNKEQDTIEELNMEI